MAKFIKRKQEEIPVKEATETVKVEVAKPPEPIFELPKSQKIIEKIVPKVVETPVVESVDAEIPDGEPKTLPMEIETPDLGQKVSDVPVYVLALTEKRGFKFKSTLIARGSYDNCVEAQRIYMKKFGTGRNERLYIQKV